MRDFITVLILVFCFLSFSDVWANDCNNPIQITLPYTNSTTTCGQGNNYSTDDACFGGSKTSNFFLGEDAVYTFVPDRDMCVTIEINNGTGGGCQVGPYDCNIGRPPGCTSFSVGSNGCTCTECDANSSSSMGIALLAACPDQTTTCIGWDDGGQTLSMCGNEVKAGQTYYIIVASGGAATACGEYDISVREADRCPFKAIELNEDIGRECSNNLGFEQGDFSGWQACTYQGVRVGNNMNGPCDDPNNLAVCPKCPNIGFDFPDPQNPPVNAAMNKCKAPAPNGWDDPPPFPTDPRFTITTGNGTDQQINEIPLVSPTGGNFSARLGNFAAHGQAECIWNTFTVDNTNWILIWQYAVVLEDPENPTNQHGLYDSPRFYAQVLDQDGNEIGCGGRFAQISLNADCDGFIKATNPSCHTPAPDRNESNIYYKKWTSVGTDLSAFMGQEVTLRFCTADCGKFGHYGYAYVDVICQAPNPEGYAICNTGETVVLDAPEGFTNYVWYEGADPSGNQIGTEPELTVQNPQEGDLFTVSFETLTGTGCRTHVTDSITVLSAEPNNFDTTVCAGQIIDLNVESKTSHPEIMDFKWYNANDPATILSTEPRLELPGIVVNEDMTFIVEMTTDIGSGCSFTDEITVRTGSPYQIEAENSCYSDGTTFHVTGNTSNINSWFWDFGDGNTSTEAEPRHIYADQGTYMVTLVLNGGGGSCDTLRTDATIDPTCEFEIWFPNVFTPDKEGIGPSPNNKARVRGEGITELEVRIFDRWGELVYHTTEIDEAMNVGWDGKYKGKPTDVDSYAWYIKAKSECCSKEEPPLFIKGSLTLLR